MTRKLAIAAVFAAGVTVTSGAAFAQQDDGWRPSWNPDVSPSNAVYDISADTTGSMFTSTNNPDRSIPAFDAQSGPRATVLANHGYSVDRVVVRHVRHYDDQGRAYYYDEDGRAYYYDGEGRVIYY